MTPVSDYLSGALASARTPEGFIEVDRNSGCSVTRTSSRSATSRPRTPKWPGSPAAGSGRGVERHGRHLGIWRTPDYESLGPVIAVTIGPDGGAGQLPGAGGVAGPEVVAQAKGRTMMVDRYAEILGASHPL